MICVMIMLQLTSFILSTLKKQKKITMYTEQKKKKLVRNKEYPGFVSRG